MQLLAILFLIKPRQIDVDSMSVLRWYVEEKQSTNLHVILSHFFDVASMYLLQGICNGRKINVVSTVFVRRNLDDRKIHIVLTCFVRCNFDWRKTHVISTYFVCHNFDGRKWPSSWLNFDEQKIYIISMYYFWLNFDGRKIDVVSLYFLMQFWRKNDANLRCWFWCFFERQNRRCRFYVSFW